MVVESVGLVVESVGPVVESVGLVVEIQSDLLRGGLLLGDGHHLPKKQLMKEEAELKE
jgi:hypothetical protein